MRRRGLSFENKMKNIDVSISHKVIKPLVLESPVLQLVVVIELFPFIRVTRCTSQRVC